jgi:archaellum component FlaC
MIDLDDDRLEAISRAIESVDSPVGIDAKKTHVLILRALERIEERLDRIEARVDAGDAASTPPPREGP